MKPAHLRFDPNASETFVEAHVRRLESMRRLAGTVEREADGRWIIAADHLNRVLAFEAARVRDRPVSIAILSPVALEKLIRADAATWLDRELISDMPLPLREAGFGAEVRTALMARRQWLIGEGLAEQQGDKIHYSRNLIETLRRRELLKVAGRLTDELRLPFTEPLQHGRIDGVLKRRLDLVSGRFALVTRARFYVGALATGT